MKNALIFAGLMVFALADNAFAAFGTGTTAAPTYGSYNEINYNAEYKYASRKLASGVEPIKVATTNYVASAVESISPKIDQLTTKANTDNTVVGSSGTSGLSKDLKDMGGGTCGSGGACDGVTSGAEAGDRLNTATLPTGQSAGTYCTGSSGGYAISACGFIKNGNARKWVQIVGGVASGS